MAAPVVRGENVQGRDDGAELTEEEKKKAGAETRAVAEAADAKAKAEKKQAADKRSNADPSFLNGGTAVAVFFGLIYWITVYTLPDPMDVGVNSLKRTIALGILYGLIAVFGLTLTMMGRGKGNIGRLQAVCLVAYVLTLDWLLASAYFRIVNYRPEVKFALAIGGLAVASFIYGTIAFDTIRAAASLPIVVLFIGLAAASNGLTIDPEIKKQLILWMGVILGANAVSEAANQGAKVVSAGKVSTAVAGSTDSPEEAGEKQRQLTSEIKAIGGDLSPSVPEANRQGTQ
jgi:hypothetical protein